MNENAFEKWWGNYLTELGDEHCFPYAAAHAAWKRSSEVSTFAICARLDKLVVTVMSLVVEGDLTLGARLDALEEMGG